MTKQDKKLTKMVLGRLVVSFLAKLTKEGSQGCYNTPPTMIMDKFLAMGMQFFPRKHEMTMLWLKQPCVGGNFSWDHPDIPRLYSPLT
jgi:hypothetical protein